MGASYRPKTFKDVLPGVMASIGLRGRKAADELRAAWGREFPDLVGRARVLGLRNGVVTLAVESAALRYELTALRKDEILSRLRSALPGRPILKIRAEL